VRESIAEPCDVLGDYIRCTRENESFLIILVSTKSAKRLERPVTTIAIMSPIARFLGPVLIAHSVTLTLRLMNTGYYDEARAWRGWLLRAAAGSPAEIQIMYGVAGERWLRARGAVARRVREFKHRAHRQRRRRPASARCLRRSGSIMRGWAVSRTLRPRGSFSARYAHLETVWRAPNEGIWEVRSGRHHFTYSKVMAWVAFDRGIKAVEAFGLDGPVDRWRRIRAEIHEEVCRPDKALSPSVLSPMPSSRSQRGILRPRVKRINFRTWHWLAKDHQ
jgi:hypothetical protein